jgi:GNAT superfamily N-acetyltransferase
VTTIREVQDPTDPALAQAYRLLTTTFHRGERVLRREWVGSLQERRDGLLTDIAWHLIVAERSGRVVGFTSGTYLGNVNLGVIGYLAIAPEARAGGLGTRLRGRLRAAFAKDAERIARKPLTGILGEVSAENPWLRSLARRPEVLALDFPYYQPRLYDGDKPSPYVLYLESMSRPRDRLATPELRRILYTLWRRVYRIGRPLDRPVFRAMLRALEGRRSVGRRPLSQPKAP